MANTFIIKVAQATIDAHVGIYPIEQNITQPIAVNIAIHMPAHLFKKEQLGTTINYEVIWQIVQKTFEQKWQLLESAAINISEIIMQTFNCTWPIEISLQKIKTVIPNYNGHVGIIYKCNF